MNENLTEIGKIDYKNGKNSNIFILSSFILFSLAGILVIFFSKSIEYNQLNWKWILLSCFAYVIFHEVTHLFFMRIFSKEKINVCVKFPTISVGSNAKFSKNQFIIIALAPVFVFGIILSLLILFTSKEYSFLWYILLTLNFASSGGDYLQTIKAKSFPKNTYFQDTGTNTTVFRFTNAVHKTEALNS